MKRLATLVATLVLLAPGAAGAATATFGNLGDTSTNDVAIATGAFTPGSGDLLVAFGACTGQSGGGTFTDSQSVGFTAATCSLLNASLDTVCVAVGLAAVSATSTTVTFTPAGAPTSTGASVAAYYVSGMSLFGAAAIRQTIGQGNQAAGGTPAPAFIGAALTDNPTFGVVGNRSNPAGISAPTGWTEGSDSGHSAPNAGLETVFRNSDFTGTTITWGGTSATAFGDVIIELDTTVPSTGPPTGTLSSMGAGR